MPALANTQPDRAPITPSVADQFGWATEQADQNSGVLSAADHAVQVAQIGPRGRVVRRGPRRTFLYRGRRVTVIRRRPFLYPPGYGYRRWGVGEVLPLALVAAPFYFLEWRDLGLRPPPPGYRWVRYGPDVVLVNARTRRVDEIVPDAIEEGDEDDQDGPPPER